MWNAHDKKGCSLNVPANKCDLETIRELKKYRKKR